MHVRKKNEVDLLKEARDKCYGRKEGRKKGRKEGYKSIFKYMEDISMKTDI